MITSTERNAIESAIHRELAAGIAKHGDWQYYTYLEMMQVIMMEIIEVMEALNHEDHHGPHGTLTELAQVAACCQKMVMQIMRREIKHGNPA